MDMEEKIETYLEEQCKIDSALAEKYNEAKYKKALIRRCIQYINEMAREELGGKSGIVKDEVVFHWAREYYVAGIAEKDQNQIQKQLAEMMANVKINNDIPEKDMERMRKSLAKARAELHQQEDVSSYENGK